MRKKGIFAALLAIVMLVSVACTDKGGNGKETEGGSGKLVIYTGRDESVVTKVVGMFNEKYPDIEVEHVRTPMPIEASVKDSAVGNPMETLKELLAIDGIPTEHLESYVTELAQKKNQPIQHVVGSAILPQLLPKFKAAYAKDLEKRATQIQASE